MICEGMDCDEPILRGHYHSNACRQRAYRERQTIRINETFIRRRNDDGTLLVSIAENRNVTYRCGQKGCDSVEAYDIGKQGGRYCYVCLACGHIYRLRSGL